jgi:hypothetical protein
MILADSEQFINISNTLKIIFARWLISTIYPDWLVLLRIEHNLKQAPFELSVSRQYKGHSDQ